jgi:putative protein kinase ArgK-like GTPase of G3E family
MPKHSANAAVGWHTPVLALSAFAPNGEGVNELWDQVRFLRVVKGELVSGYYGTRYVSCA